jgi:hypothetical protein
MMQFFIWLLILCGKYTYAPTVLTKQEMEELYLPLDTTQLLEPSPSPRPIVEADTDDWCSAIYYIVFGKTSKRRRNHEDKIVSDWDDGLCACLEHNDLYDAFYETLDKPLLERLLGRCALREPHCNNPLPMCDFVREELAPTH